MQKEVYGRKSSYAGAVTSSEILASNKHVYTDCNEFAPPFSQLHKGNSYLGGRNIISLLYPTNWKFMRCGLIYSAAEVMLRDAETFFYEYGKVKTVDSVRDEWKNFMKSITYAMRYLPEDIPERTNILKELGRLKEVAYWILCGMKGANVEKTPVIDNLVGLLTLFKNVPLDKALCIKS